MSALGVREGLLYELLTPEEREQDALVSAAALAAALPVRDYELHPVPDWHAGLSASLRAAARALHGHAGPVLVTGVDQPALEARHLRALLDGARGMMGRKDKEGE